MTSVPASPQSMTGARLRHSLRADAMRTSLGLGIVPNVDDDDLLNPPQPKPPGLKGGADNNQGPVMSALSGLSGMTSAAFEDYALNFVSASPITSIQVSVGLGLHFLDMFGILPYRTVLFHPRLILAPYWQTHRTVTSFLAMGLSTVDVAQRALGTFYYQAPLETFINGSGDTYRGGRLIHEGRQRLLPNGRSTTFLGLSGLKLLGRSKAAEAAQQNQDTSNIPARRRKNMVEWLITDNKFLHTQLLSAATLVFIELVVNEAVPSLSPQPVPGSASSYLIFPYSLYPNLEYATRWTWGLSTMEREIVMFGVIPVKPHYLPIVLCAMGGFSQWKALLKGLAASIIVSHLMELKRFDGENVVEWAYHQALDWYYWIEALANAGKKGKGPAYTPAAGSSSRSSGASSSTSQGRNQPIPEVGSSSRIAELPIQEEIYSAVAGGLASLGFTTSTRRP
ncbi:hypothetical protein BJ742DRAFT_785145 [Cladochytrium replicatum]|nr:hypothetical protein BJ742DRAFT_785145 [Cladochytrium replicatum]